MLLCFVLQFDLPAVDRDAVKLAVLDGDVAEVAVAASAELDRVAERPHAAISHDYVRDGERLVALGLEAERVVVRIEVAVLHRHVARLYVKPVVHPVAVIEAARALHRHAVAVPQVTRPRAGVGVVEALQAYVAAAREAHEERQRLRLVLTTELGRLPEPAAASVDRALPDDGDVRPEV